VARPVFKTATEAPSAAPVGSIPTRSRHPGAVTRLAAGLVLVLVAGSGAAPVARLAAQDTTRARPDTAARDSARRDSLARATVRPDSVRRDTAAAAPPAAKGPRPVSPGAALWRSLALPGWGQLKLGRKLTAGLFIAGEGLTLGMTIKANRDLNHLRAIGADSVALDDKSQQREDWLVLLVVNHLLSGLEAYIAANLADFPAELKVERGPGWIGLGVGVPVRIR
jgi:hypothetical protein